MGALDGSVGPPWLHLTAVVAILWLVSAIGSVAATDSDVYDSSSEGPVPLRRWQVESTTVEVHGDVDALGYVYVKSRLQESRKPMQSDVVGPPFKMILDTGSSFSYLPCSGCTQESCGARRMERYLNREHESTELLCSDPMCPVSDKFGCEQTQFGMADDCIMKKEYPGGSGMEGTYVTVQMNVSQYYSWQEMACATMLSPSFQDQFADGALGMGKDAPFLNMNANGFSLCLAPAGFYGGNLTIGKAMDFANLKQNTWIQIKQSADHVNGKSDPQYRVELKNDTPLFVGETGVKSPRHLGATFNTGSSLSWLPSDFFKEVRTQLFAECGRKGAACPGSRVTGDAEALACYNLASHIDAVPEEVKKEGGARLELAIMSIKAKFPSLTFMVQDKEGTKLDYKIEPREYFYGVGEQTFCIGFMDDKSSQSDIQFGVNVMRGWNFAVDLEQERLTLELCDLKFDLASLRREEELVEKLEDNSGIAFAGLIGFLLSFCVIISFFCFCRRVCCASTASYDVIGGARSVNVQHAIPSTGDDDRHDDVELASKFAIDSDDSDPEEDSEDYDEPKSHGHHALSSDDSDDDDDLALVEEKEGHKAITRKG